MRRYRTNAVYTKELKQSVRNIKFPITVGLYCFIVAVIGLFTLVAISAYGYPIYSTYTIKQDFITFYDVYAAYITYFRIHRKLWGAYVRDI